MPTKEDLLAERDFLKHVQDKVLNLLKDNSDALDEIYTSELEEIIGDWWKSVDTAHKFADFNWYYGVTSSLAHEELRRYVKSVKPKGIRFWDTSTWALDDEDKVTYPMLHVGFKKEDKSNLTEVAKAIVDWTKVWGYDTNRVNIMEHTLSQYESYAINVEELKIEFGRGWREDKQFNTLVELLEWVRENLWYESDSERDWEC